MKHLRLAGGVLAPGGELRGAKRVGELQKDLSLLSNTAQRGIGWTTPRTVLQNDTFFFSFFFPVVGPFPTMERFQIRGDQTEVTVFFRRVLLL